MKQTLVFLVCIAWGALSGFSANPLRVPIHFAITNDAGLGNEWFVVGNHPDVGSWDPAHAVKLVWSEGDVWWGDIGVLAGTALEYKFVKRLTAPESICDSENQVEWWPEGDGNNLQMQVPVGPDAPFTGKRIEFWSDMTNVNLRYSLLSSADFNATGTWQTVGMTVAGQGFRSGEWRHVAEGVGEEGAWMRFTFNGLRDGADTWEGAWDMNDYWTPLDAMVVRDRQVFNYVPPSNGVAVSRVVGTNVGSSVVGVAGRDIRIYVPRGYDENPDRSYPVVYMSDGENVFFPGGTYGCWYADTTADEEIRGGRMRETIVVGVPSGAERTVEYLPHMDWYDGHQGRADLYADYLIHNVRPTIDSHYRTKNNRENTGCIGSSSGGLLAMYLGTWTNVFGLVGALSGVYDTNFCPNYMEWLAVEQPHDARVMDVGNEGGDIAIGDTLLYQSNLELYWDLLGFGYVPNCDLRFMVGCGQEHNETAWASRLAYIYRFLLDVREEPNGYLPQNMTLSDRDIAFPVYRGTTYSVEQSEGLTNGWAAITNWVREIRPWSEQIFTLPSDATGFFRVKGE